MIAQDLRKGARLADGAVVDSDVCHDHGTYVARVVRYDNNEVRVRTFDPAEDVKLWPAAARFATGRHHDEHIDIRASNRYERRLGL